MGEKTLENELEYIKVNLPIAWDYIKELYDRAEEEGFQRGTTAELPAFDDNDEMLDRSY